MTLALMFSGKRVNVNAPRLDQIDANDIAVNLSRLPMYRGATWGFMGYSIAQHSVLVAAEVNRIEGPHAALYALLHHADEALAPRLHDFQHERRIAAIHGAFDLNWPAPREIPEALDFAHACVEMTEKRQLLKNCADEIAALEKAGARPLPGMIKPMPADKARVRFLDALRVNAVAAQIPAAAMPAMGGVW